LTQLVRLHSRRCIWLAKVSGRKSARWQSLGLQTSAYTLGQQLGFQLWGKRHLATFLDVQAKHVLICIPLRVCSLTGPSGRCYSFDERAEGYGRGEGISTVIVKSLDAAIRDKDPIRAVIR
jgi:hypothetical protein